MEKLDRKNSLKWERILDLYSMKFYEPSDEIDQHLDGQRKIQTGAFNRWTTSEYNILLQALTFTYLRQSVLDVRHHAGDVLGEDPVERGSPLAVLPQ